MQSLESRSQNPRGLQTLRFWPWDFLRDSIHHSTPSAFPNNVPLFCTALGHSKSRMIFFKYLHWFISCSTFTGLGKFSLLVELHWGGSATIRATTSSLVNKTKFSICFGAINTNYRKQHILAKQNLGFIGNIEQLAIFWVVLALLCNSYDHDF